MCQYPFPCAHLCAPESIMFRDGESFFCGLGTVSPVSSGRNASRIMLCSHRVLSDLVCPVRDIYTEQNYSVLFPTPSVLNRHCVRACCEFFFPSLFL